MKKIVLAIIGIIAISTTMFAQTPSFRERGYKGSVSFSNMCIFCNGFETSHGYMFDEQNYLGAGLGGYFMLAIPSDNPYALLLSVYADYHHYWSDKSSTLMSGIKMGGNNMISAGSSSGFVPYAEPNIGWSWGTKSGHGCTLSAGACIFLTSKVVALPKLSFAFEF